MPFGVYVEPPKGPLVGSEALERLDTKRNHLVRPAIARNGLTVQVVLETLCPPRQTPLCQLASSATVPATILSTCRLSKTPLEPPMLDFVVAHCHEVTELAPLWADLGSRIHMGPSNNGQ